MRESAAGHRSEMFPGKREPLIRFYYTDREDMFDGHSYDKGGQVLNLLRQYVGDDAFFASLKLYLTNKMFSSGEIDDLRLAFEQTTGKDMHWFFNEWFMERGHPELDITYNYDDATKKERVIIKQTQDRTDGTPIFRIPLSVDIYNGGKVDRQEILVKSLCDTFSFPYVMKPDFVNVDAQKTLPCYKVDHHTADEWAFLFNNSKLYVDRVEAINNLAPKPLDNSVANGNTNPLPQQIITKALDDEFWAIRNLACRKIGQCAGKVKDKLIALSKNDPKSDVRASALVALSEGADENDLKDVDLAALNDKSYLVVGTALTALVKHYPEVGFAECAKRENDPARSMKLAVGQAYALGGTEAQQPWFEKTMTTLFGQHQMEFIQQYGALLRRCSKETVDKALPALENLYHNTTSPGTLQYIKGTLRDVERFYQQKSADTQKKIDDLKSVKNNATGLQKLEADKAEYDAIANDIDAVVKRLK